MPKQSFEKLKAEKQGNELLENLREAVNSYKEKHPNAPMEEIVACLVLERKKVLEGDSEKAIKDILQGGIVWGDMAIPDSIYEIITEEFKLQEWQKACSIAYKLIEKNR